jgi:hypothetical protein
LEALVISIVKPGRLPPPEDRVFLDRQNFLCWKKLPGAVRGELGQRREEIAAIRADIARKAKVRVMPPVQITSNAMMSCNHRDIIHAGAGRVRVGNVKQFGVLLSGATAFFASPVDLREILLHGFSHCLWLTRHALRTNMPARDPGAPWLDCGVFEDDSDDLYLDHPGDWFGEMDARVFKWRTRDLFPVGRDKIFYQWADGLRLPCVFGPTAYSVHDEIAIDPELVDYCEELNSRDRPHPRSDLWYRRRWPSSAG